MSATLRREEGADHPPQTTVPGGVATSEPRTPNAASVSATAPRHAPVFSINFVRHQTVSLRVRRTLASVALGYLAVNVLVAVGLVGMALSAHLQWRTLRYPLQGTTPSVDAVNGVGQEMAMLQARATEDLTQLTTMAAEQRQRFPVAGKLAALTKTLPPRTWITGLSGTRESRTLTVHAAYLVDSNGPYALPTKGWMETLRADPSFGPGLKRLDLTSSSRKTQGTAELVVFELAAEWQSSPDH